MEAQMTVEEIREAIAGMTVEEIAGMDAATETKVMYLYRLHLDHKISFEELSDAKWDLYLND